MVQVTSQPLQFLQQFRSARLVSTPLIAVKTPDPAATIESIMATLNGRSGETPVLQWDIVRGLSGLNESGKAAFTALNVDPAVTTNLVETLGLAATLPSKSILFLSNAQRVINEQGVSQGIWNLRNPFKQSQRTCVMLCPGIELPAELSQDVLILDEPLPTNDELAGIIRGIYQAGGLDVPDETIVDKAVDAVCGLAAFPAEQVTAMSLRKTGLDLTALWDRKRAVIEATPGLSVWRGGETFEDLGGCDNAKFFLRSILKGQAAPRCIVFMDEIEKQFAGSGTDLSGVSTEMTGEILSEMQDKGYVGCIFIGPPGAAKSAIAKATGNEGGIPTISFNLSAMKGSLVGESSARLRQALKVVRAVSQGKALFIATCNSWGQLPPELRRRFSLGTFFFDLPTADERQTIWTIWCKKYSVGGEIPDDESWTGAEIRNCTDIAWRLGISLCEAARFVVPVARSAADQIEKLRQQANGRFISAGSSGVYRYEQRPLTGAGGSRSIRIED